MSVNVREATEADVPAIADIFSAVYGHEYPYQHFYDHGWLKASVYGEGVLMLVAEEEGKVLGTASVMCELGATSDLLGEFGRLVVHPDGRGKGLGRALMEARLEHVRDRLHVGVVEARCVHPFAQRISASSGFSAVGFLPNKHAIIGRESVAYLARYFGDALELRKNHPRIIPEVYPLAALALESVGLGADVIVDESSPAYPVSSDFSLDSLKDRGYSSLLRMERGRVKNREIFGPMRLQYGFFKMKASQASYLLARSGDRIMGALGFIRDDFEQVVKVFELISTTDAVIRFLLKELEEKCRKDWQAQYVEIDVSAHAPRMQRTLMQLGFMPVAYIPAMVFDEVERLDVVRMVRLPESVELGALQLIPDVQRFCDLAMRGFATQRIAPQIRRAAHATALFEGLDKDQLTRLAGACRVGVFSAGAPLFCEGDSSDRMMLILEGKAAVLKGEPGVRIGEVGPGETLGELSLLTRKTRSASAVAETELEAAILDYRELEQLIRLRPDIALALYRNLAVGLGQKLKRASESLAAEAERGGRA